MPNQETAPKKLDQEQPPNKSEKLATFLDGFNASGVGRANSTNEHITDMQAQAKKDIPEAVASGDLDTPQIILEGNWEAADDKGLKNERLAALRELHVAEKGEPTTEQKGRATEDISAALAEMAGREKEVAEFAATVLRAKGGNVEIEKAIDFIEDMIAEENILQKDPERLESLRTARDQQFDRFEREKSHQDARQTMIDDFVDTVGEDNELFPREKIESLIGPRWSDGPGLEDSANIVAMAKAETDLDKKTELLGDLMELKIPIGSLDKMEEWYQKRAQASAASHEITRKAHVVAARENLAAVFAAMNGAAPPRPTESHELPAPPPVAAEPSSRRVQPTALKPVKVLKQPVETPPPLPKQQEVKREVEILSPEKPQDKGEFDQLSTETAQSLHTIGNILGHHANHQVVGELIRDIASERSHKSEKPVDPAELDKTLKDRLNGRDLPDSFDPYSSGTISQKVSVGDWPKPNSPIWAENNPQTPLGKINLENRRDLRILLEELLK